MNNDLRSRPHIFFTRGTWKCKVPGDAYPLGFGASPADAYANWIMQRMVLRVPA